MSSSPPSSSSSRPAPSTASLIEGDVGGILVRLTSPMVVGFISLMGFNLVDTWFASQLGPDALAAMTFTFPIVGLVMGMTIGISIGATAVISRCVGAGRTDEMRAMTRDSLLFAIGMVLLLCTVGFATMDETFALMGAEPRMIPLIRSYMEVWYLGMVFIVVPMMGNGAIRAGGDTKTPAKIMMIAAGANVLFDPLLMFGYGPIPGYGLAGGAWASNISRVGTMCAAVYVLRKRDMLSTRLPSWTEMLGNWKSMLRVGVPAATTNLLLPISQGVLTGIIAGYGLSAVGAFGAGGRIAALSLMIPMGMSGALAPILGQNFGARRLDRIERALTLCLRFSVVYGALVWLLLAGLAPYIAAAFLEDAEAAATLEMFLRVVPLGFGAEAIGFTVSATFNTLGRPMQSTFLNALRMFVLSVPAAMLGGQLWGVPGIFAGLAGGNLIAALIAAIWLARFRAAELRPRATIT